MRKTNYRKKIPQVTTAKDSQQADIRARMFKYCLSMGIRMVCIILMLFVKGWLVWVMLTAAIILPYLAVLVANVSGMNKFEDTHNLLSSPPKLEVDTDFVEESLVEGEVVKGEVVKNTIISAEEK